MAGTDKHCMISCMCCRWNGVRYRQRTRDHQGLERGGRGLLLNEQGVPAWDGEKFVEMGDSDDCTRAWM